MMASFRELTLAGLLVSGMASPVFAEPPMNVDDAGTLAKGGMKVEGALGRDHQERGGELVFGFAPVEHLEVGLAVARATDRTDDPSTRLRGAGISLKWVPVQNDTGWSLGASLAYARTRVDERATPAKFTEKDYALTALATYRFASEQVMHLNLGRVRYQVPGERQTLGTWGAGFEQPLADNLKLTAEIFGEEHARPDKAIGLRHEVAEGLKVSGAVGRGNGRSFGQVGFSWEF